MSHSTFSRHMVHNSSDDGQQPQLQGTHEKERRRREEADKARRDAEKKIQPTTLPQFLDACHIHVQAGLAVQSADLSTKGDPSNARQKKRPTYMREWSEFPCRQVAIWLPSGTNSCALLS